MASSISFNSSGNAAYGGRHFVVSCTQTKNIAKNTSTISWTLTATGGDALYYSTGPTTLTIGGTTVYSASRKEWNASTVEFPAKKGSVSGTVEKAHDSNGNLTLTVSLTSAVYVGATGTNSVSWTLDSIPRQATITSAPNFNDNSNPVLKYRNPAGNSVSELKACISLTTAVDNIDYRDISKTGSSYTFNLTDAERNNLRNNTTSGSRDVYFIVRTKIGSETFYSSSKVKFTVQETDATKPDVSMNISADNTVLSDAFSGLFIQGKSKATVTLTATPKYNASISKYSTIIDGEEYTSASFTTDTLITSGTQSIVGTATDSRKFKGSDTQDIDVYSYSAPFVGVADGESQIICYRGNDSGEKDNSSTKVWVKCKRNYSKINVEGTQKNFCVLRWRSKSASEDWGSQSWNTLIAKNSISNDVYNGYISTTEFDIKSEYTIQIGVLDDIGEYRSISFNIPTDDVPLHLAEGGKVTAIGRYADTSKPYSFQIGWESYFDKPVYADEENGSFNGTLNGNVGIKSCPDSILDFALSCKVGLTPFITGSNTTDAPTSFNGSKHFAYSSGVVIRRSASYADVFLKSYHTGVIASNNYKQGRTPSEWSGWELTDPIVEQGTSGIWTYRKYASGIGECWGTVKHGITFTGQWGNLVEGPKLPAVSYPFTFKKKPIETATITTESGDYTAQCFLGTSTYATQSTKQTATYIPLRPNAVTDIRYYWLNYHVIGNWK